MCTTVIYTCHDDRQEFLWGGGGFGPLLGFLSGTCSWTSARNSRTVLAFAQRQPSMCSSQLENWLFFHKTPNIHLAFKISIKSIMSS